MTRETHITDAPQKRSFMRYLPLVIIGAALAAVLMLGLDKYLSFDALEHHHKTLKNWVDNHAVASALIFVGLYTVVIALSVPGGTLMTVGGGFLFGTVLGGSLALLGATLGAIGIFMAARTAFGDMLRGRLPGSAMEKLREGFAEDAFNYMLSLRLIPLFPFWLVNLAPAFLGVGLRTYAIATFLGILPGTFVYASVGTGVGALLKMGEEPDMGIIFQPQVLLPLVGLGV
ncbi:MAG: TVP38/TMEM64 family protein, partial [Pseudomonadota bacterium]